MDEDTVNGAGDTSDWVSAKALLAMMRGASPNTSPAENKLRVGLRAGLVGARAKVASVTGRPPHQNMSRQFVDWNVEPAAWTGGAGNSTFSLFRDTYTSRDFGTGYGSVSLTGLSFNRSQVMEFLEIEPPSPTAQGNSSLPVKNKGGAPLDSEKWSNLVAVLAGYLSCRELNAGMRHGQLYKGLLDYADRIGAEIPSKTQATEAMKLALKLSAAEHDTNFNPLYDKDGNPLVDAN